jgi:hypothetical protein
LRQLQYLTTDRFNLLKGLFANNNTETEKQMEIIHEHIHWIILVSGSILADAGEGEKPLIPNSLMQLSGVQVSRD